MINWFEKYGYAPDAEEIGGILESTAAAVDTVNSPEILKRCFSLMDLTTLKNNDTVSSVTKLVSKVNAMETEHPGYPVPASICVYPNFAGVVREARRNPELHVTTVAGCFPTSQSFIEVKCRECELAVEAGADEIDIVLALNLFLAGDEQGAFNEICQIRKTVDAAGKAVGREVTLKVILETGLLADAERIARASYLAMEAGADFIKTSTGKVDVNATPMAAYVMCSCIKAFYGKTGRKVGFKAAGGISTAEDALSYYLIVRTVLGEEWLNKNLFRFGVSRLGNSLMSAVEKKDVKFF